MNEKGQLELETIVKLVVVLVVLAVILLFVSGGFGSMGGRLANTTKDTTSSVDDAKATIGTGSSSGACSVVDEDTHDCKVKVIHPSCAIEGDYSATAPTPPGYTEPTVVPSESGPWFTPPAFCAGKCKIKVTACWGSPYKTFQYTVWEV